MLWVLISLNEALLMSWNNIFFRGEIKNYQYFWTEKKASYQELCITLKNVYG